MAAGRDFDFEYIGARSAETAEMTWNNGLHYRELIHGVSRTLHDVKVGMLGRHQAANAAVALATLGQLQRLGWSIEESAVRVGLERAHCPARFEVVGREPAIILDAAHNPASVAALSVALAEQFPGQPRRLVFATSVDKDVPRMLEQLLPGFERVVLTRYLNNPRAMDPVVLEKLARDIALNRGWSSLQLDVRQDPHAAWQSIRSQATRSHVICVAGSFFLVAEMRDYLEASGQEAAGASTSFR